MRIARYITCVLLLCSITYHVAAQNNKEKAKEAGNKALKLEQEGKTDEALSLLKEAQKLDPENYIYPYEIANCYREKKDYKSALKSMEQVMTYKGIGPDAYQMQGNLYDLSGDSVSAINSYADGLYYFPNAGNLYLELGNLYYIRRQYDNSMPYYEKGIEVDPMFSSNYYHAAELLMFSPQAVAGIVYGELFLNLERSTERTVTMSKFIHDSYPGHISAKPKKDIMINFCPNMAIPDSNMKDGKVIRLPFCMAYESIMLAAAEGTETVNTESVCNMRRKFLDLWYKDNMNVKYPNVLFEYQHTVQQAGHLDAYNHWVVMHGDKEAFSKWQSGHKVEWDNFIKWFKAHPVKVTQQNVFTSQKAG